MVGSIPFDDGRTLGYADTDAAGRYRLSLERVAAPAGTLLEPQLFSAEEQGEPRAEPSFVIAHDGGSGCEAEAHLPHAPAPAAAALFRAVAPGELTGVDAAALHCSFAGAGRWRASGLVAWTRRSAASWRSSRGIPPERPGCGVSHGLFRVAPPPS